MSFLDIFRTGDALLQKLYLQEQRVEDCFIDLTSKEEGILGFVFRAECWCDEHVLLEMKDSTETSLYRSDGHVKVTRTWIRR